MTDTNDSSNTGKLFESFVEKIKFLRSEEGCLWDRQQDFESMCPHLMEEAREVVEAVQSGDISSVREELGDLLLHVVFFSQIAAESGEFTITDVIHEIKQKIIRRHPHVFGDLELSSTEEIVTSWEKIKQEERSNS